MESEVRGITPNLNAYLQSVEFSQDVDSKKSVLSRFDCQSNPVITSRSNRNGVELHQVRQIVDGHVPGCHNIGRRFDLERARLPNRDVEFASASAAANEHVGNHPDRYALARRPW
jgi:hypothetical protein